MKSTDDQGLIPVIVASEADTTYIRTIPTAQATSGDGSVSLDLGLPPECAISVAAGGKRPEMKDMNGIWNLFSRAIQALQAYRGVYDATFATAIGGYPKYALVSDSSGNFWVSTADSNTTTPGASGASWKSLFDGLQTALGFTPVQQGGGTNQTTDKINLGQDSSYSGIVRVSINGSDAGGLLSGTYGKSALDYQMLGLYQQSTTGRPVAVFNNGTTTVYNGIANYTDVTAVQTNLTDFQTSQATTNSELSADISDCVSGIYGKSSSDYQMLGFYQQGSTGRPVAVFNNGTTTVYNGIANYTDVTAETSAREAADTTIQNNLTQAISNQSSVNDSVTTALAAKVGTNASNDGTNSPVSLFNYYISTGVPWISGDGFSTSIVKTSPASGYYQLENFVTDENHALIAQDSTGSYSYAPSSAKILSDTVSVTKVGDLVIQTFEVSISNASNGGAGSVVITLPEALTQSIQFAKGNAISGTQGATNWIPSVNVFPTSLTEVTVYADNLQDLNWTNAVTIQVLVIGS